MENNSSQNEDSNAKFSATTPYNNPQERKVILMNDEQYIEKRLGNQITWYENESSKNKRKYKQIKRAESVIAALIPVLIMFGAFKIVQEYDLAGVLQAIAAFAGVALVIMNSFLELDEYHRLWKEYRLTCEMLKHEHFMYVTGCEPYDEVDAFPRLVEKVESILSSETQRWKQIDKKSDKITRNSTSKEDENRKD